MQTQHHHPAPPQDLDPHPVQSLREHGAPATLLGAISTYLAILPGSPLRPDLLRIARELERK